MKCYKKLKLSFMQQIKSFQLSVRVFKMHAKYMQMFVNIRAMSICLYSLSYNSTGQKGNYWEAYSVRKENDISKTNSTIKYAGQKHSWRWAQSFLINCWIFKSICTMLSSVRMHLSSIAWLFKISLLLSL